MNIPGLVRYPVQLYLFLLCLQSDMKSGIVLVEGNTTLILSIAAFNWSNWEWYLCELNV